MVKTFKYPLLVLLLLLCTVVSQAAQLKAVTDRTRTSMEESFTLELRANGSVDGEPELSALEKDFEILGRSQSSQLQIVNGEFNRTTTWSLSLLPRTEGKKQIPSLCVGSDCSQPLTIEVLAAGQSSSATNNANEIRLEVDLSPDKVRVQSQLLYKVSLLTRLNFLQASLTDPEPSGVETVVQKLGEDRSYETERNGLRYRVIERTYALFPQQSGMMTIPPIRFAAQISEGGRGSFDPFNQRTRQLRKHSEEITIEVLPATAVNGRNWLPASNVQLNDDWQNQKPVLTVGEPATRTMSLRAFGLPAAQIPALNISLPEGVKSYPDQPSRDDQFNENGIIGTLQQKLALVPTSAGTLLLPEVKVDWWDIESERWRQEILPEIELDVKAAVRQPETNKIASNVESETPATMKEPHTIETQTTLKEDGQLWRWTTLALGCAWLVTLILLFKKNGSPLKAKDKEKQEDKAVTLRAVNRELKQALRSNDQALIRKALLDWGLIIFPEQKPKNLEELARLCGEPMRRQVETLNRSAYSRGAEPWDSRGLIEAMQQVEEEAGKKDKVGKLPSLYPH